MTEREQIAAWLVRQAPKVEEMHDELASVIVEELADAIKRGDHLKQEGA